MSSRSRYNGVRGALADGRDAGGQGTRHRGNRKAYPSSHVPCPMSRGRDGLKCRLPKGGEHVRHLASNESCFEEPNTRFR